MSNKRKRTKSAAEGTALSSTSGPRSFDYHVRKRPSLADRGRNNAELNYQSELNYNDGDDNSSSRPPPARTVKSYGELNYGDFSRDPVPTSRQQQTLQSYQDSNSNQSVARPQEQDPAQPKLYSGNHDLMNNPNQKNSVVETLDARNMENARAIRKILPYDDAFIGQSDPSQLTNDDHNKDKEVTGNEEDGYYDDFEEDEVNDSNKQYTSGPSDPHSGQRSAFPIGRLTILQSDLSTPPVNVADYLARVQKEASEIPAVTRVAKSSSSNQPEVTNQSHSKTRGFGYEDTMKIDSKWYRQFVKATFPATRARLLLHSAAGKGPKSITHKDLPQSLVDWRKHLLTHSPSSLFLHALPHSVLLTLFQYACKWTTTNMPPQLCSWIYGMLVVLPDTLDGQEVSLLRRLAKKCIAVHMKQDHRPTIQVECFLKFTVSVVAGIYAQSDLIELV